MMQRRDVEVEGTDDSCRGEMLMWREGMTHAEERC